MLDDIKYELREDMEPRDLLGTFKLECGRVVGISGLHVTATYAGLLEGTPNTKVDNWFVASFRKGVRAYWGDRPIHVIAPKIYHLETHCGRTSRWMPPVTYHAWLQSAALSGSEKFASELVVIWFGEREKGLTLFETTKRALWQLSWDELAGECDLD